MWKTDQQDGDVIVDQQQDVEGDCSYKFLSKQANPLLDDFLDDWRDELYRKNCILRLNDDCFYKIFSYLPTVDLCAMRETCRDLRRAADDYFEMRNKHLSLKVWTLSDVKRIIRNFGQFVIKCSIEHIKHEDPIRLLPLLDRYCIKLQDLELHMRVSEQQVVDIIQHVRLLSNLHRLKITNLNFGYYAPLELGSILALCVSLKQLNLNGWTCFRDASEVGLTQHCKSLEGVSFRNCIIQSTDLFTDFFNNNFHLKRVKISSCRKFNAFLLAYERVCISLPTFPNLEALSIQSIEHPRRPFGIEHMRFCMTIHTGNNFSTLKKLQIDYKCVLNLDISSLLFILAVHNNIESLQITHIIELDDKLIGHLCALKNLKILSFTSLRNGLDAEASKKLACEMSNLTEISFIHCGSMEVTSIESFAEYAKNITRIVFDRENFRRNPLTETELLSLVNARLRNKQNTEKLLLHLSDMSIKQFKFNVLTRWRWLEEYANVIKLCPF